MDSSQETPEDKIRRLEEEIKLLRSELQTKDALLQQQKPQTPTQNPNTSNKKTEILSQLHPELQSPKFATYKKRPGTTDTGKEYEYMMCALYAIKLATNQEIADFEMTTNDPCYGDFDDISLKISFIDGTTSHYLLQLKHKEDSKKFVTDTDFSSPKNDYSLVKYLKSFEKSDIDDAYVILYTNCQTRMKTGFEFTIESGSKDLILARVEEYGGNSLDLLNNSKESKKNIFQFQLIPNGNEFKKIGAFSKQFYFLAAQENITSLRSMVRQLLITLLKQDIYDVFVNFIRGWWLGCFVLTKHDIVAKLTELALAPWCRPLSNRRCNSKVENIVKAIMKFELTVVNGQDDTAAEIWPRIVGENFGKVGQKYGISGKEDKLLWYLEKVPLVVKVDGENEDKVKCALDLLQKCKGNKRIVLIGNFGELLQWHVFENLFNIFCEDRTMYDEIVRTYKVSLQGRPPITLEEIIQNDQEFLRIIKVKELLEMSQNDHLIIGPIEKETLPEIYVPRTLSTHIINTQHTLGYCTNLRNCVLIINCKEQFKDHSCLRTLNVKEVDQFLSESTRPKIHNLVLLSINKKCSVKQFQKVLQILKKFIGYLIEMVDESYSVLLLKEGPDLPVKKSAFILWNKQIFCKKVYIGEKKVFTYFHDRLNVFCAPPGMGKSTLLRMLGGRYCPPDYWSIYVNLIDHNSSLVKKPNSEDILTIFLGSDKPLDDFSLRVREKFLQNKKFHLFLDGMDEVDSDLVEHLLDFIKNISSSGVHVWVSSRENLHQRIVQSLNKIPIVIEELDEDEQTVYIQSRLQNTYEEREIDKIIDAVSASAEVTNNQQLLGIPLQLYIITEMFLNNKDAYKNLDHQQIFVLTNMYKLFFEGKKKFLYGKIGVLQFENQLGFNFDHHLKQYEVLGLKAALDENDFRRFNLELGENFISSIRKTGDKFGIIKQISEDGQIVFDHQTYAEYFACVWLHNHLDEANFLREKLFTQRYENLKLMFDIMMAEDNPLHLSIFYKNLSQFEEHFPNYADKNDKGGRTVLHLVCCYGTKYPAEEYFSWERIGCESKQFIKMMRIILDQSFDIFQKDEIFSFNSLDYALKSRCIYPLEQMLEIKKVDIQNLDLELSTFEAETLAYYSAQLGYPNLLTAMIQRYSVDVNNDKFGSFGLLGAAVLGSEEGTSAPREGNIAAVDILIKNGANIHTNRAFYYESILDYAARKKRLDMVEVLVQVHQLECTEKNNFLHRVAKYGIVYSYIIDLSKKLEIDINAQNESGQTPLHIASKKTDPESVYKLLKNGADVNVVDIEGNSVVHYAVQTWVENTEILGSLVRYGGDINAPNGCGETALHIACKYGKSENVLQLLALGADVNAVDDRNNNALHFTVRTWTNNMEVIDALLSYNINVNAQNVDGTTALLIACEKGQLDIVKKLVENGADVNVVDVSGNSALHYASKCWTDNGEIISFLAHNNVSLNCQNVFGQTALHLACQVCNMENGKKLLELGSDISVVDKDDKHVLYYVNKSRWFQKTQMKELLLTYDSDDAIQYEIQNCVE